MASKEVVGAMDALERSGSDHDAAHHAGSGRGVLYSGWVYHLGVNSIGYEYCHLRFLFLRGNFVAMYKRDPHDHPGINPIRKGVISHNLMVEELGRRKVNDGDVYVLRLYNRLDETKKGEIACATAGEARKWMEAFDQAKQQAEWDLLRGSNKHRLNTETELNLEGHRPRVRRYAHGFRKLIRIGKGPEMLLRQSSELGRNVQTNMNYEGDVGDAIGAHEWRCVRTLHGNRVFEDVVNSKVGKDILLKTVGVIDANVDTVFEVILSLDKKMRYEWDTLTGDLEVVDSVDGHYDIVYGTFDLKYHLRWHSKKDFVFSRQWFRGQDGAYTILQFPAVHKKQPPRSGYQRIKINPSIWEIRRLNSSQSPIERCLVTQFLEIHYSRWDKWRRRYTSDCEKPIPYALLCQVAGLREFFRANPSLTFDSPSIVVSPNSSDGSNAHAEFEDSEAQEEFYDAIANGDLLEDEDSDDDNDDDNDVKPPKGGKVKLKNVSWALASLALKRRPVSAENELDANTPPISINLSQFHSSLCLGKGETDSNCWSSPSGQGFMIRGKSYLKDSSKV
ncbi:hypothetical protein J5N97_003180 [Dioscorea zingiberensis]|uniref:START domain-containing protein n=1 Tax=Dioscorea zingiberensis TaxID=325984 RepID=A0A9D5D543_9LILI|nr:hypothetical protein J5N97_003180 [Dioscorea zingiberensis]